MWFSRKPEIKTQSEPQPDPRAAALAAAAALADALPDPTLLVAGSGNVLHANAGAVEMLGQDPTGAHVSSAIRAPVVLAAFAEVASGAKGPAKVEFESRVPMPRHYEAWIAQLQGSHRDGVAVLISLKDLTREQMIERMRADFVANASHELRTPLTALLGFVETLQGPAREDAGARERFLIMMRQQGERMKRLIDDLLSLSRIEMNAHQRPQGQVDLSQLTRQVVDSLKPVAEAQHVEISLDLTLDLMVRGDSDELAQVLQNLIENALKYGASGKRVEVKVQRREGQAEVSVRDFGQGIAAEHLPRLTERFYRVSAQESRARGGTGLGLAIVKHILNRHRGGLAIQSSPGAGSVFSAQLPLVDS